MATKQALKRLTKEYKLIVENPPQFIEARPNEDNILEWHYIITGPPDTPYLNGQYHGTLTFPSDYPYKPPAIRIITPNGRFKENTRLCLSMSDYHPDLWNPGWSVSTILTGLLSFMTGDETTTGSIVTTEQQKKYYAAKSMEFNTFHNTRFRMIFPDVVDKNMIELENRKAKGDPEMTELKESSKFNNAIAKAVNEKAINIEDIQDPEDRIRAEEALREMNENQDENNEDKGKAGKSQVYYIAFAIVLFLLGVFMK
ncbi:ubiquitin-conjugating enzyme E2 6 [Monosporozyma unispora]|nr:Ubiquitin-conjugating enzyme E2 6 [Kazachstania unispora]